MYMGGCAVYSGARPTCKWRSHGTVLHSDTGASNANSERLLSQIEKLNIQLAG